MSRIAMVVCRCLFAEQLVGIRKSMINRYSQSARRRINPVSVSVVMCLAVEILASNGLSSQVEPEIGRPGKDVMWVPSADALVDKMLEIADVSARDTVMDLGSGDGRTVIAAARLGARAIGVEYDSELVTLSRDNAVAASVADRVTFMTADLFQVDLSPATVITMFLLPDLNLKLRSRLLKLRPGTRIEYVGPR